MGEKFNTAVWPPHAKCVEKKIFSEKKSWELPKLPDLKNEVYTTIWADSEPILKKPQRARILGPSDIFQHT